MEKAELTQVEQFGSPHVVFDPAGRYAGARRSHSVSRVSFSLCVRWRCLLSGWAFCGLFRCGRSKGRCGRRQAGDEARNG
jgi:hypothetical protein